MKGEKGPTMTLASMAIYLLCLAIRFSEWQRIQSPDWGWAEKQANHSSWSAI